MKKAFSRRLLSLALTVLFMAVAGVGAGLILSVSAAVDPAHEAFWGPSTDYTNSGTIQEAINYANGLTSGTAYIKLNKDVVLSSGLSISPQRTVYLDLAGKKIDRGLVSAASNGYVLYIRCNLTITDSVGGGQITGGYNSGFGGGILVQEGSLTLKGGSVINNKSTADGGGIYSLSSAKVIIDGGIVTFNQSWSRGGGVYAAGDFEIKSGEVSHNISSAKGGGLYVAGGCTVSGGSVEYNTAGDAPGGLLYGTLSLSGNPKILNNTLSTSTGSVKSNVLVEGQQISIASAGLDATAQIGVTVGTPPTSSSMTVFTGYSNKDYTSNFVSDNANFVMEKYSIGSNYAVAVALQYLVWGVDSTYSDGAGDVAALTAYMSGRTGVLYVKLQRDLTLTTPLVIPDTMTVRLDLNGCALQRNHSTAQADGNVLTVRGTLILDDSLGYGMITGGKTTGYGGGILVYGTLTINRAKIHANTASNGGGIYLENGATLTINSGSTITSNTANQSGGGIYASGRLTISESVNISKNSAQYGGGIYIDPTGNVEFSGNVNDNSALLGGGGVYFNGNQFTVSGSAYVYGNKTGSSTGNIFLSAGKIITIDTSKGLAGNARMGITTAVIPTAADPVTLISAVASDHSGYFTSDNSSYGIKNSVSGTSYVLKLCNQSVAVGTPSGTLTRGVSASGLTIQVTTTGVSNGMPATITWYSDASKTSKGDNYKPLGVTLSPAGSVNNNKVVLNLSSSGSSRAGDFYFTVTVDGMESDISILTIARTKLSVPTVSGNYYYTGYNQTVSLSGFDSSSMTIVSGNVQKNVGRDYVVVISIKDPTQYMWSDGSTGEKYVKWDINKARVTQPTVSGDHYYKGVNQTANLSNFNSSLMTISGNERKEIGTYTIIVSLKDTANYEWDGLNHSANISLTWEIKKAPLTIKANDITITYGDAFSAYTVSYSGFVGGDSASVLTGTLKLDCSYRQYSNAGTYTITPSGLSGANYEITYVPGTLTVEKKPVTVIWENTSFTYDGKSHLPSATLSGYSGTSKIVVSGSRVDAGTYTAEATGFNDINFRLANPSVTFTISPLSLTVKANDHTIVYGQSPEGNGVVYSGFLAGESSANLSGTLSYTFTYNQYGDVGSYKITPTGLSSQNYTITYVQGTLTVTKAPLSIKLNDVRSLKTDEALTYEVVSGKFYNGDESRLTILRVPGDAPGKYLISASLASDNYDCTITDATYTILQSDVKTFGEVYGIAANASGGLNPDYRLSVKPVDIKSLKKTVDEGKVLAAYDVSLLNNMVSVQPDGSLTIKFPVSEFAEYEKIGVIHVDKQGNSQLLSSTREGNYLVVTVDSLSTFAIVDLAPANFAWVWILSIAAIVVLGGGLGVYLVATKKKQ